MCLAWGVGAGCSKFVTSRPPPNVLPGRFYHTGARLATRTAGLDSRRVRPRRRRRLTTLRGPAYDDRGDISVEGLPASNAGYRQLYLTRPCLEGPDVLAVQQRLLELGFDPYGLDGVFGPMSQAAVVTFQRSKGLDDNGVVDDATFRALGFTPGAPVPPAPGGPWDRPKRVSVVIDSAARQLSVFGSTRQLLRVYPCAVGKPSTPSPEGDWEILTKVVNPSWPVLGSRWMGLSVPSGNYGVHGTNNDASIGQALSNGCVRLHNWDAEELFDWAVIGTPVKIVAQS